MVVFVKGTYTIEPAEETPTGIMYVSDVDNSAPMTHTPTLHFYRPPPRDSPLNPFQTIKQALSRALSIFYPLAGRLQWSSSSRERLEINCNSAGALFLEAESDWTVDYFGDFRPTPAMAELIPAVDYKSQPIEQQPLLLVQLTKFSCGGISLGLRISHVLADGMASSHFILEWARIARGYEPKMVPFLDRSILKPPDDLPPPCFDHSDYKKTPLVIGQTNDLDERKKETTTVVLTLSKEQVSKLRDEANRNGHYSRFVVVSAHMWRCVCKARGHHYNQQTALRITVDFRNRIKPKLPEGYFGNALVPVAALATAGELLAKPLSYTCGKIRETIDKVNDEFMMSCLSYLNISVNDQAKYRCFTVLGTEQGAFFGNPNFCSTSWLSLPLHGTDFGWGKDIYMGNGLIGADGKSFVSPGRQEEGSLVVALRLQVAHMDAFKEFFYSDI